MGKTAIEWTRGDDGSAGETWNPVAGCSIVSPGCTNCYAMRMAGRLRSMGLPHYASLTQSSKAGAVWTGEVALAPERVLLAPLSWKKPRRVFVNSMSDLFHESIPDEWIDRTFAVMALCPQHVFQVLTKRAERMREYQKNPETRNRQARINAEMIAGFDASACKRLGVTWNHKPWPLPNVWLGVSAERQQEWDERKGHLAATPAIVRFASFEPLLGPIIEPCRMSAYLNWAIVGGESGPDARPMHPDWARSLRDQCTSDRVPFFFKQWGEYREFDTGSPKAVPINADGDVAKLARKQCFKPSWVTMEGRHILRHANIPIDTPCRLIDRVGKKFAGRLLDGREHNDMPKAVVV